MKKIRNTFFVCILLSIILVPIFKVEASNSPTFSVKPILPENQIGTTKSYFNLLLNPKEDTQVIEVELSNSGEKPISVEIAMVTARSNENGIVDYSKSSEKLDKSAMFSFEESSEMESPVLLEGGETKVVPISIKLPNKVFNGLLLGGINFSEKLSEEDEKQQQIGNRFAYTVAVMLSQNDTMVSPDLKLLDVSASQSNYRNIILARIQNPKMTLISNISVEANVYTEKGKTPLFSKKATSLKMAPTSFLPFKIPTSNKPLKAGVYRLEMKATIDDKEWAWDETFEIDSKTAKKLNESAVGIEEDPTLIIVGIFFAVFISLSVIVYFIFRYHKKKKKLEAERKKRIMRKKQLMRKKQSMKRKQKVIEKKQEG